MRKPEERIEAEGKVLPGEILKIDSFLNHQVDSELMEEIGEEFARRFSEYGVEKVLTIEASGIPPALMTARALKVPMVFAKKSGSSNIGKNVYTAAVHSIPMTGIS